MLSIFLNVAMFVGVFYLITMFAAAGDSKPETTRSKRAA
jgi:hypothetical protein